jgi:hypothetical protein
MVPYRNACSQGCQMKFSKKSIKPFKKKQKKAMALEKKHKKSNFFLSNNKFKKIYF